MFKSIFAAALLVAMVAGKTPLSTKGDFFWHPTDNGGYVPAFLNSGARALTKADESDVHMWLYTPSCKQGYELIVGDDASLASSCYMAGKPLKIISHGFSSNGQSGPGPLLRDAYFDAGHDCNVVIIDWKAIAAAPWYDRAAAGTKIVGQKTARMILHLMAARVLNSPNDVHVMGHSLGSHVAGWVGSTLGAGQLGRITAMDPALPLFGEKPDSERIDSSDAKFVDVIHTAGGSILEGALAFTDPRGHVDFYPNEGTPPQAGCSGEFFGTCSHSRSYEFMEESIRKPTSFRSCLCNSWTEFWLGSCSCSQTATMGEGSTGCSHGRYYLVTNPNKPFSQH